MTRSKLLEGGGGNLALRAFALLCALALSMGLLPVIPAAYADDGLVAGRAQFELETMAADGAVSGGSTIDASGTYQLADDATGTITVGENLDVTLVGKGLETTFKGLNIKVGNATTLTIQDIHANQGTQDGSGSTIDFLGDGALKLSGTNLIDNDGGLNAAVIHVAAGQEVHFGGTGTLYGYKSALCSYIGGNAEEANGTIVIDNGYWFLKGTKTGAVIGGDSTTAKGGDIVINGGELYVKGVAKGALLGGSNQGLAGDVYIKGGLVELFEDFSGPAIGAGSQDNAGNVYVTGGSLKTTLSSNSANSYGTAADFGGMPGVSWKAVKAKNSADYALLPFDVSAYISDLANDTVSVSVDGSPFYTGRTYTYVTNEIKNPTSNVAGCDTMANWLANDAANLVTEADYGGEAYPTKDGSSLVPEKNLYFALSKQGHTLTVNGEAFDVAWDEDEQVFSCAPLYDWNSKVWAGGLDFSWYDENNVASSYHISTPAQWEALAWICSEDIDKLATLGDDSYTAGNIVSIKGTRPTRQQTFEGVQFYLDNDIDMGGAVVDGVWSGPNYYPIGSQAQNDKANGQFYGLFYGNFDGQGHIVKNVYCKRGTDQNSQSVGLFGRVGAPDDSTPYPEVDIVIQNVAVTGYIDSGRSVGGIVGKTLHVAAGHSLTIKNCLNFATVTSHQKKGVGGICGAFWNAPYMYDCASFGTAGGGSPLGSIVGGNEGTIENVYALQDAALAGEKATSTASVANGFRMGTGKSSEEMKTEEFAILMAGGDTKWVFPTEDDAIYAVMADAGVQGYPVPQVFSSASAPIPNLAMADVTLDADEYAYTGSAIKPAITVKLPNGKDVTNGVKALYSNNTKVGTAKVILVGDGINIAGSRSDTTFSVVAAQLSDEFIATIPNQLYTGSAVEPAVEVTDVNGNKLKAEEDYVAAYFDNVEVGQGKVTVVGLGNYAGTADAQFSIVEPEDISGASITGVADKTYTGSVLSQSVKVELGGKSLKQGTDFALSYDNNVNVGTATVTVTGKGFYAGTVSKTFKISAASIADASLSAADQTYTGKALTPAPTVKLGSTTLKAGTDYTVAYSDNVYAGTATATVTGKGNYTGTVSKTFKIAAASIAKASVVVANKTYTGKALKPAPTVKLGSTNLKSGTDYTVSYKNNVKAGKATVTVKGKGNYSGSVSKTFTIAKAANPMTVKAKAPSVKYNKSKASTLAVSKVLKVATNKGGALTYAKKSGNAKIKVAKNGKVTVAKGLKKGTYSIKIKVTAKANANYKAASKTITVKIKVK